MTHHLVIALFDLAPCASSRFSHPFNQLHNPPFQSLHGKTILMPAIDLRHFLVYWWSPLICQKLSFVAFVAVEPLLYKGFTWYSLICVLIIIHLIQVCPIDVFKEDVSIWLHSANMLEQGFSNYTCSSEMLPIGLTSLKLVQLTYFGSLLQKMTWQS